MTHAPLFLYVAAVLAVIFVPVLILNRRRIFCAHRWHYSPSVSAKRGTAWERCTKCDARRRLA